ncbi:hypothetical protein D3C84_998810 [compost metagenome]
MGAEAAVLVVMIMIMLDRRMSDSQWQQGERQSEKQTTHDESPKRLCNLITKARRV